MMNSSNKNTHNLEEHIRDMAKKETPDLWSRIELSLPPQDSSEQVASPPTPEAPSRKKPRISKQMIFRFSGIAAAVLCVIVLLNLFRTSTDEAEDKLIDSLVPTYSVESTVPPTTALATPNENKSDTLSEDPEGVTDSTNISSDNVHGNDFSTEYTILLQDSYDEANMLYYFTSASISDTLAVLDCCSLTTEEWELLQNGESLTIQLRESYTLEDGITLFYVIH